MNYTSKQTKQIKQIIIDTIRYFNIRDYNSKDIETIITLTREKLSHNCFDL